MDSFLSNFVYGNKVPPSFVEDKETKQATKKPSRFSDVSLEDFRFPEAQKNSSYTNYKNSIFKTSSTLSSQGSSLDNQSSSVFAKYNSAPPPKSSKEISSYQTRTSRFQTESSTFSSSGKSSGNQNTNKGTFNSRQSDTSARSTSRDSYNQGNTSQQQGSKSLSGKSPRSMDNYSQFDNNASGYGSASADYSMGASYSESYLGNYASDNFSGTRGGCKLCGVSQFFSDQDETLHNSSQAHCQKFLQEELKLGFEAFKKKYSNAIFGKETVGALGKAEYTTNEQKQFFRAGLLLGFKCELCNVATTTHTSWMDHMEGIKHALAYLKFLNENGYEEYLKKFPGLPKPPAERIQGARKKMEAQAKFLQQKQYPSQNQYGDQEKTAGGSGVPPLMFQPPKPPQSLIQKGGFNQGKQGGGGGGGGKKNQGGKKGSKQGNGGGQQGKGGQFSQQGGRYGDQGGQYGQGVGSYGQQGSDQYGPSGGQYNQGDGPYDQQSGPYGQNDGSYGQQSGSYGQRDGSFDQQSGRYGQRDGPYGEWDGPYGQRDGPYGPSGGQGNGQQGNDFGPYNNQGGQQGRQNEGPWNQQNQGPGQYGNQGGNSYVKNDGDRTKAKPQIDLNQFDNMRGPDGKPLNAKERKKLRWDMICKARDLEREKALAAEQLAELNQSAEPNRSAGGLGNNARSNWGGGRDKYDAYRDRMDNDDDWEREMGEYKQSLREREENLKWEAEREKLRLERERVLQEVELERKKLQLEQEIFKKELEARQRGLLQPSYYENPSSSALGAMGWGEDRGLGLQHQKEIMEAKMAEQMQQQQLLQQQMAAAMLQQQEQLMQEQLAKQMQQQQQLLAEQAKVKALNNQMAEMQKMMRELEDTQKMYQQSMDTVIEQQQKIAQLNKLKTDMDNKDTRRVETRIVDTRVVDMEMDVNDSQGTSRGPSFPQYSLQRGNLFGQQSGGQFGQQSGGQFSQQSGGQFSQQSGGQFSQQSGGQFSQQSGGQFSQEVDQYNDQSRGQFTHQSGGQSQQYLDQPATMARTIEQEQVAKYSQQRNVESRDPKKTTFEMSQGEQNLWGPEATSFSPSQQFTGKSARNKRRAKEKPSRWRHEMGEMRKNLRVNTKQSPTERPRQLQGAVATLKASRGESIEPKNPPLIAGKMEKVGRVAENKLRRYLKYKEKVKERNEQEAVTGVKIPPLIDPTADLTGRPRRNPDGSMLLPTQPPSKAGVDKEALKEAIVILNNTVQQYIQHLLSNKEALAKMDRGTLVTIEAAVTNLAASLSQQDTGGEQQMPDVQRMMSALSSLDPKMLANLVSTEPQLQGINLQDMMKGLENMASQPM